MNFRGLITTAILALLTALVIIVVSPSDANSEKLLQAAIGLVVVLAVAAVVTLWRRYEPHPLRFIAKALVRFGVTGLKEWAEAEREAAEGDTVWDWLTDQVFVVQRRYAFSVGCIAFGWHNGRLRCLMISRPFRGFDENVMLWPGGRVRGADKDFESEVRRIVKVETGCNVTLLAYDKKPNRVFCEEVHTYNPKTGSVDISNSLLQSPILVMQQNRVQSHEVPGHIDLLYLGDVDPHQTPRARGVWLEMDTLDNLPTHTLWPDTRVCVKHAAEVYERVKPRP